MIINESENSIDNDSYKNVCDFSYLMAMTGGKRQLIKEITDVFLKQVAEELQSINDAITKTDYATIKSFAHTMQSSVSVMGITVLKSVLRDMENLGAAATDGLTPLTTNIERIKELNQKLNLICNQAFKEIEKEKLNYL